MPKQSSFTSTNSKMGGIPQYEKGGVVTKPKESNMYNAGMGQPPENPDMVTSLTPEQRKSYEKAKQMPSGVGKPAKVLPAGQRPTGLRYTGEVTQGGKGYESFRDSTGREVLMPKR
jgi:hypothetical protein